MSVVKGHQDSSSSIPIAEFLGAFVPLVYRSNDRITSKPAFKLILLTFLLARRANLCQRFARGSRHYLGSGFLIDGKKIGHFGF